MDLQILERLFHPIIGMELLAAGSAEHRSATPDDPADIVVAERPDLPVDHPLVSLPDPVDLEAPRQPHAYHRPDTCVHSRRIAAAGEDSNSFHSLSCWFRC